MEAKKGEEIRKTWVFKNVGTENIPFDFKLVKVEGESIFGPSEILINKAVSQDGLFEIHLKTNMPAEGDHYRSVYQFHTSDGQHFGEKVAIEIR